MIALVLYTKTQSMLSPLIQTRTKLKRADRGVTPIGYDISNTHAKLWNTIHSWAAAAHDPQSWTASVVELAQRDRASLGLSNEGRSWNWSAPRRAQQRLLTQVPPCRLRWLCVFDPNARYAKPATKHWIEDAEEIDPQKIYGLDTDPPRPPQSSNRLYAEEVQNPLAWPPPPVSGMAISPEI